jgi:Arc/MetJ-type ribon-helix-helix transcriptional regulator
MGLKKIGISVDEKTYAAAQEAVKSGEYRNISHVFEYAAKQLLRDRIMKLEKSENPCKALA